jgi:hypothetical protein
VIIGLLILAALIVLVVFLARNMMPADRSGSQRDVDDLTSTTAYTADHSSHCGDHSFDGDCGGGH